MYTTINDPNDPGRLLAKSWCPVIEESAMEQIHALADHPFLYKWAAIMPDCHMGQGVTIGSVVPTEHVIIPNAVGMDIGCGMCSVKTNIHVDEIQPVLAKIEHSIRRSIPVGFNHRKETDKTTWPLIENDDEIRGTIDRLELSYPGKQVMPQLGTLGGGNHFIELQKDCNGIVYIMIHSGSRNIGARVASYYIKGAKEFAEKYRMSTPKGLEFLHEDSTIGAHYLEDMEYALLFAYWNRKVMMSFIQKDIKHELPDVTFENMINIHHNYVTKEHHFGKNVWVHRKGATKVTSDIIGIIPGSMGDHSYLVKGKDNVDSFNSCSHGAGRRMSRTKAKATLSLELFTSQMKDVISTSVNMGHLDEAPGAYKYIEDVMLNQTDLVEILTELTPIMNIKG